MTQLQPNLPPRRIALVGMAQLPEPDPDEAPLLGALREAGFDAQVLHWDSDDAAHDPAAFDVCVLRATWDYHRRPQRFEAWLRRAASVSILRNPLATVLWNMHKRYLLQLERVGLPIIPTVLLERGSRRTVADIAGANDWREIVIKPAVSAASWQTKRFAPDETESAERFLREQTAARDTLIQPYLAEVEGGGEVSIVWIDGQVTHAIRKTPRFDGGDERVQPCSVESRHITFAHRAMQAAGQDASYARVDVVERADGSIVLSELELIEPSLHFHHSPPALCRFVDAVGRLAPNEATGPHRE